MKHWLWLKHCEKKSCGTTLSLGRQDGAGVEWTLLLILFGTLLVAALALMSGLQYVSCMFLS